MGAKTSLRQWFDSFGGITTAVAVCALGRALDFATTWVALGRGCAVEYQPLAMHVFHALGRNAGMITYESLITTPAIFLGCRLVTRNFCIGSSRQPEKTILRKRMFFVSIGIISVIVATFNARYLM
ncbi:MAG: hypothetical protein ACLP0A_18395 [Verrucomicrobiia bacterium]